MTDKASSLTMSTSLKSLFDSICPNKSCAETHEDKALCPNEDKDSTWATAGSDVILQLSRVTEKDIKAIIATIFVMNPKVRVSGEGSASCPTKRGYINDVSAWDKTSSKVCGPWPVQSAESSSTPKESLETPRVYKFLKGDVQAAVHSAAEAARVYFKDDSEDPSKGWSRSEQAASLENLLKPEHLNQVIGATCPAEPQGAQ